MGSGFFVTRRASLASKPIVGGSQLMRFRPVFLYICAALLAQVAGFAQEAKKPRGAYPATYEGGALPLSRNKVKATLGQDSVIFEQNQQRIVVSFKDITRISCGNEVRRRLGAAVLDVVPRLRLGESEDYYIGMTWTDSARTVEAVFRLNKSAYDEFVASLERSTGMKAVDTARVATVVHYAF